MAKAKTKNPKKTVDPTLETSLNSDLVEQGFKNIYGDTVESKEK